MSKDQVVEIVAIASVVERGWGWGWGGYGSCHPLNEKPSLYWYQKDSFHMTFPEIFLEDL